MSLRSLEKNKISPPFPGVRISARRSRVSEGGKRSDTISVSHPPGKSDAPLRNRRLCGFVKARSARFHFTSGRSVPSLRPITADCRGHCPGLTERAHVLFGCRRLSACAALSEAVGQKKFSRSRLTIFSVILQYPSRKSQAFCGRRRRGNYRMGRLAIRYSARQASRIVGLKMLFSIR